MGISQTWLCVASAVLCSSGFRASIPHGQGGCAVEQCAFIPSLGEAGLGGLY